MRDLLSVRPDLVFSFLQLFLSRSPLPFYFPFLRSNSIAVADRWVGRAPWGSDFGILTSALTDKPIMPSIRARRVKSVLACANRCRDIMESRRVGK